MNSEKLPSLEASPSASASPLMRAVSASAPSHEQHSPRHMSPHLLQQPTRSTPAGTADEGYNSGSFSRNAPPALEHPATLEPLDVPQNGEPPLSATESEVSACRFTLSRCNNIAFSKLIIFRLIKSRMRNCLHFLN